jgi:hypothetical protein
LRIAEHAAYTERKRNAFKMLARKPEVGDSFEDIGVDGRLILK